MAWNYPEISLEEMVKLIKGFVDILILASGYQSSGLLAHWDAHNIKKAFQWGSFFENVLRHMSSSDDYQDSLKELDAALSKMTSDPYFPQGLANLSYDTLCQAQNFVFTHLFHPLPLRDSHLRAFLTAIVEMDLDKLSESEHDCLSLYLKKLVLKSKPVPERSCLVKDLIITSAGIAPTMKIGKFTDDEWTKFTLQELFNRQSAVSCISKVETGLDILFSAVRCSTWTESDDSFLKEKLKHDRFPALVGSAERLVDFDTWNYWKSKNISYFLDMRTIRLVSGASMIFSAPKIQWVQAFEQFNTSAEFKDDDLLEAMELLLLGSIASKWNCLIEYYVSVSYDSFTITKLYHEVCNLLAGKPQGFHSKEEATNSKESGILEYLARWLGGRLHLLWKLSPVLVAVAIPFWSPLFKLYLSEIETQFKGDSSTRRCCNCMQDRKEHEDCQLAERIWCLHIFHVRRSPVMHGGSSA